MAQLSSLLRCTAVSDPARPAVAYGDAQLSFGELAARCDLIARRLGVVPGERVAVVAPNVPALVIGMFAVWQSDAVAVPLSSRLGSFELRRAIADCDATRVLVAGSPAATAEIRAIAAEARAPAACTVLSPLGEILAEDDGPAPSRDRAAALSSDIAAILYTSGTTGQPKGVLVSHSAAVDQGRQMATLLGPHADAPAGFVVPIAHAFGLLCLLGSIAAGGLVVLIEHTTSLKPLVEAMQRRAGRVLHGTPALFHRLAASGAQLAIASGFTAGSSCPPDTLAALDERGTRILNLYGMTEIGAASSCRLDDPPELRHHTVGRALQGYELRVVAGEVQVRGPFASGYHGRPWSDAETAGDGWFRTGDVGTIDAAGNLTISGRIKEVVQVGGFNVFPAEVESFLLTHPDVAQAAVVGIAHPTMGEALRAFVVPEAGATVDPTDVVRFARAGIAGYKVPYGVKVMAALPLLPSGKPDRSALTEMAQAKEAVS